MKPENDDQVKAPPTLRSGSRSGDRVGVQAPATKAAPPPSPKEA